MLKSFNEVICMKKIIAYVVCIFFLVSFVFASDLCKESDDGRDYAEQGFVKYGVTEYDDVCVLSPDADMRVEEGQYLKEYYCDDDNRRHEIIDCSREGFDKCEDGMCISSSGSNVSTPSTPVVTGPVCGNKIVESGEECDPPTKICYKGSDIGLCSNICQCDIKISSGEESEEESDTEENESVADQGLAEEDTVEPEQEPIEEENVEAAESVSANDPDGVPSTQTDRLALPKEPKKGLFSRIWAWFAGLFS